MYNLKNDQSVDANYQNGLLPQRNKKGVFYQDSSCRSNLSDFSLSSENRRILGKTQSFTFSIIPLSDFVFDLDLQKQIYSWVKTLGWDFPVSSIKTIFTNHIFNYVYVWSDSSKVVAYSVCYFSQRVSHIAYVFYDPQYSRSSLPIRLSLQVIIDSQEKKMDYCYLGRFNPQEGTGYYKRTLPAFEYFDHQQWIKFNS